MQGLATLSYIGLMIAALSAAWGILHKYTSTKKKSKVKFTWQDGVSLGIVGIAMLVSLVAQWREDTLKAQEKALGDLKEIAGHNQREADKRWSDEREGVRIREARNQENENAMRSRLLAVELENRKLLRDIGLSRLVTLRTNSLLEKSYYLINESERALDKFDEIRVEIFWCLLKNDPALGHLDLDYDKIYSQVEREPGLTWQEGGFAKISPPHPLIGPLRQANFMGVIPKVEIFEKGNSEPDSIFIGQTAIDSSPSIKNSEIFFDTVQVMKRVSRQNFKSKIRSTADLADASVRIGYNIDFAFAFKSVADRDLDWSGRLGVRHVQIEAGGQTYTFGAEALNPVNKKSVFEAKFSAANAAYPGWNCIIPRDW